jgi:hypothetical protein
MKNCAAHGIDKRSQLSNAGPCAGHSVSQRRAVTRVASWRQSIVHRQQALEWCDGFD